MVELQIKDYVDMEIASAMISRNAEKIDDLIELNEILQGLVDNNNAAIKCSTNINQTVGMISIRVPSLQISLTAIGDLYESRESDPT